MHQVQLAFINGTTSFDYDIGYIFSNNSAVAVSPGPKATLKPSVPFL